jgi:3-oxoadipate enol-lactonase
MKIKANGISMNYEIKGKGENLVLIHAVGDNLNAWYHQVPVFSKSYRVITYDMRGFGKTDSPEGVYSVEVMTQDLYELMKALKVERAYFAGHSLGGRISLELAINYPDMVKALIFANSSPALTPPPREGEDSMRKSMELMEKGDIKTVAESSLAMFVAPDFKAKNPAEYKKYLKIKLQNKIDGVARVTRATLGGPPHPVDITKAKCPILLIVGEYDRPMFVEGAANIHKAMPGSKMVVLPTGHAAAIELPDRFNAAVLEFLSEIAGK